jgi:phage tail-like protein
MSSNVPHGNFNFRVEIDGLAVASFSEVSGLAAGIDVFEYRTVEDPTIRKLPGTVRTDNLVLRRGIDANHELWDWFKQTRDGQVQRRDGVVILQDAAGDAVRRWEFFGAWPIRYEGPSLDASKNEVAIETLELAVERLEVEAP